MALEQAGVELIAKNYREYVNQLRKVDKAQQTVFKQRSSQTVQAHRQAARAAKTHEKQVQLLASAYKLLGPLILAAIGGSVIQGLRKAGELAEQAIDFQRLEGQFEHLAVSSGQSAQELIDSMERASGGMLSMSEKVTLALSIMRLEVAATPAEMEEFVRLGLALRPAGSDAADAVERLTTALGRKSLQRLDDFNISADRAKREMEALSQAKFGVPTDELDDATKSMLFMETALAAMRADFEAMGGDTVEWVDQTRVLKAAWEDLGVTIGEILVPGAQTINSELAKGVDFLREWAIMLAAMGSAADTLIKTLSAGVGGLADLFQPGGFIRLASGGIEEILEEGKNIGDVFRDAWEEAKEAAQETFDDLSGVQDLQKQDTEDITNNYKEQGDQVKENTDLIREQASALKDQLRTAERAAKIQLSFTRAQEDAIRRAGKAADKLQKQQADELLDLRKDLDEQLADLDKDRAEESEKLAEETTKTIKRSQDGLNRQLRQAQERFNLTRLQTERRFHVQDRRLRAEGNILALMDLREDHRLSQRENKENFNLQQKQQKESSAAQLREQVQDLQTRAKELTKDLEERRKEIFASYDKELAELQLAHEEQREEQSAALAEQLEDLRRNRARQLEDLGRNLGEQQQMTKEGAEKIAGEIERVFGSQGVADQVMQGYEDRTTGRWARIFGDLERRIASTEARLKSVPRLPATGGGASLPPPAGIGMRQGMMDIVQGPQTLFVEPGVRELVMASPVPAVGGRSSLDVNMSGGFNITGAEAAGKAATEAALDRMVIEFETAVRRMGRSM